MYFPKNFNRTRAVELVELVNEAYNQYEAYEQRQEWSAPKGYILERELLYTGYPTDRIFEEIRFFERELGNFMPSFLKKGRRLPIGFIARRYRDLYIVFRGTMTPVEWIRNLDTSLKKFFIPNFGKVHEGFLNIYKIFRKEINETLDNTSDISRIFVAGHSLGGALATLLSADMTVLRRHEPHSVYTFGSPRVGDNDFVASYNCCLASKTFRVVNTSDMVVSVPFPAPIMGFWGGYFSHVDTPVDFTLQNTDLDKNHKIQVYMEALKQSRQRWSFLRNIFS